METVNISEWVQSQRNLWTKITENLRIDKNDTYYFSKFEVWFCSFYLKNKRVPSLDESTLFTH